jgi:bacillithiol biosynthesis cysteine-adding enzyme BshC
VRSLAEPGACCVITGQQPGLFASPLFTLYKALHAIRLARTLAQAWEVPVVPLFWNHGDDHDVAEVHHTWLLNDNFDLQRIGLAGISSGRQPVSRIRLSDDKHRLSAVREATRQTLARCEFVDDALELFAPRDGDTFATALTRSLMRALGHLGLVVVEPDWIRERLSRSLSRVVVAPVADALAESDRALRRQQLEPAIDFATAALLFRVDEHGRHGLRLGGDGFQYDGENGSRTAHELAAEIVQDVDAWSPGALLRPIAQDSSLPVAAYVGGWGELAYHAQLGPLRRALQMPRATLIPRVSCTLVDPETSAALAQLELSLADALSRDVDTQEEKVSVPVADELRRIAERAAKDLLAQREALAELDRGLAQNLGRTASQIRALIEKMCEKAERVHANNQGRGRRLVRRVANTLRPRGELQERVLGPLPFVARFGRGWIDELFEQLGAFERAHVAAIWSDEVTR